MNSLNKLLFIASLLMLVSCNTTVNNQKSQGSFYIKPFVTNVTYNKAEIIWVQDSLTKPMKVIIKNHKGLSTSSKISSIDGKQQVIHIVSLKNLKQDTEYEYIIKTKTGNFAGKFKTSPTENVPLNFDIYGDTRTFSEKHKEVSDKIAEDNPDFVVCTGDLVENGDIWEQWKTQFFDPAYSYLNKTVIWPVRGNHEGNGYFFQKLFIVLEHKEYFSFNYGNLHVIILDQLISLNRYEEMKDWLIHDLENDSALWTIVSYHIPTYNIGGHNSKWGRDSFLPIFEKYGVDLIVTGHSHLYERFKPISTTGAKPIIHIVSGGGGAPLYPVSASPLLEGNIGKSVLHHLNFKITGNQLKMLAIQSNGEIIDSIKLIKEHGTYQKEIIEKTLSLEETQRLNSIFGDISGIFTPAVPKKGSKILIKVPNLGFEDNSSIKIANDNENSFWKIEEQNCTVKDKSIEFYAIALGNILVSINGYEHPLSFKISFTDKGKEYNDYTTQIKISDKTLKQCITAPEMIGIPYNKNIIVDGDLIDWGNIKYLYLPYHNNLSNEVKFAWSKKGLFISLDITDDSILVDKVNPYKGDGFELFFDKKYSRSATLNPDCFQLTFAPNLDFDQGAAFQLFNFKSINLSTENVKSVWKKTAKGYIMEIFLPSSLICNSELQSNMIFGLNFSINNNGEPKTEFYYNKAKDFSYQKPISWGAIQLQ